MIAKEEPALRSEDAMKCAEHGNNQDDQRCRTSDLSLEPIGAESGQQSWAMLHRRPKT